jgi:hypothetical protein
MSGDPALLPCPFCGGDGSIEGYDEGKYGYYVACISVECYATVGEGYDRDAMPDHQFATIELAAAAWNMRTTVNPEAKS